MKSKCLLLLTAMWITLGAFGQAPDASPPPNSITAAAVIDRAIERERSLERRMATLRPLIETYTQTMQKHPVLEVVPKGDQYFLGQLDFDLTSGIRQKSLLPESGWVGGLWQSLKQIYSVNFAPEAFASMILLAPNFEKSRYAFTYVRQELLGEVGCFVFDVQPAKPSSPAFTGRIWIENRDFNIVRFNGSRTPSKGAQSSFHFDSWRENVGPGLWLPAYVYTEESDAAYFLGTRKLHFKGQTRLWGYNAVGTYPQNVASANLPATDAALRRSAEDKILHRLQAAGLLARSGPVDEVLETVVNNIVITNNLDIQPSVRARVLLTTPLESFSVGSTIVVSKGFIDVLPDEASLAFVLAHELAHIHLRHSSETRSRFYDPALFADPETFAKRFLRWTPAEENAADKAGIGFLMNSPYGDQLYGAALFLRALEERSADLPRLLRPHLLTPTTAQNGNGRRMAGLIPEMDLARIDQIAALPLGGRIRVDPWTDTIELRKVKNIPLQSPREKMPFEVTPVFLFLTRRDGAK